MRSANFVEETTVSIAGTGGNGDITLTALASTPRFSTVFGTQATSIRYVIEDTVGKRFETGLGTVAGNVLTRTRPQITWDGTTYVDNAPAALAFGSAPASGNVRVRLAAVAASQAATVPAVQTLLGSDPFRDYPFTSIAQSNATLGSNQVISANVEHYHAYKLDGSGLLNGAQLSVFTAGGTTIKWALYSCGSSGLPGPKLVEFNPVSSATTGTKTDTVTSTWSPAGPMYLEPGWYYIGLICDAGIGMRGDGGGAGGRLTTPLGRVGGYGQGSICTKAGSHATGMPAVPNLTGGGLLAGAQWFFLGLRLA